MGDTGPAHFATVAQAAAMFVATNLDNIGGSSAGDTSFCPSSSSVRGRSLFRWEGVLVAESEIIEFCALAAHYDGIAGILATLRVPLDCPESPQ